MPPDRYDERGLPVTSIFTEDSTATEPNTKTRAATATAVGQLRTDIEFTELSETTELRAATTPHGYGVDGRARIELLPEVPCHRHSPVAQGPCRRTDSRSCPRSRRKRDAVRLRKTVSLFTGGLHAQWSTSEEYLPAGQATDGERSSTVTNGCGRSAGVRSSIGREIGRQSIFPQYYGKFGKPVCA
jgi:hypothetical protein